MARDDNHDGIDDDTGIPLTTEQLRDITGYSVNSNSSSSGLPAWAQKYAERWIRQSAPTAWKSYKDSLAALNNSDTFIDQQRGLMNDQYRRDIMQPTQNAIGNSMNQFMGKGTFGSSMMGDWARNFGGQMNQGMLTAQNQSNQWAAQSKLGMLGQRVNANQSFADMMRQLLGITSTTQSGGSGYTQGALP